jgi:hypothetical protein
MLRDLSWAVVIGFVAICALINTLDREGKKEEEIKDLTEETEVCEWQR